MGEGKSLARRNTTLLSTAIAGTAALWAVTIATAVAELGNDRIFITLLAGAITVAAATVALRSRMSGEQQVNRVQVELKNAVSEAADGLHDAVEHAQDTLRREQAVITAAHNVLDAELADAGRR